MSDDVKRWDPPAASDEYMVEDVTGGYVLAADHDRVVTELNEDIAKLKSENRDDRVRLNQCLDEIARFKDGYKYAVAVRQKARIDELETQLADILLELQAAVNEDFTAPDYTKKVVTEMLERIRKEGQP